MHHKIQPEWPIDRCLLAGTSKDNVGIQKNFLPSFQLLKKIKTNFFQRNVLPTRFLSQNSRCDNFEERTPILGMDMSLLS